MGRNYPHRRLDVEGLSEALEAALRVYRRSGSSPPTTAELARRVRMETSGALCSLNRMAEAGVVRKTDDKPVRWELA